MSIAEGIGIKTWPDNKEGNERAEAFVVGLCNKNLPQPLTEEDIDAVLDNGYCSIGNGCVLIVHSEHNKIERS